MPAAPRKYVVDTNLFIDGFRDEAANLDLQRFHAAFAPFVHLHAVVAYELRAGTRSAADRGVTLITANARDFQRIARHVAFKYIPPWPA